MDSELAGGLNLPSDFLHTPVLICFAMFIKLGENPCLRGKH